MHRSSRFVTRRVRCASHAFGVGYAHSVDPRGPWNVHVIRIDLRRADIELRPVRARQQLQGRERPTEMVRRSFSAKAQILAAINADFFDIGTGENENNQILDGEWWKGLKVTDSPFDTNESAPVQFAIDGARQPYIDRFILDGKVWNRGVMIALMTVNARFRGRYERTTL